MVKSLTCPSKLDNFIGLSCTEIQAGLSMQQQQQQQGDGKPINMLCAQKIGDTDFTQYNSIVIPYCTQDVHVGSSIMEYDSTYGQRQLDDANNDQDGKVRHMGAHNLMSTLRWIFDNFPAPTHVVLTGCSAGGTGVPIVYDLVQKHYNHFGMRKVQITTIIDSPVYLTPSYFLQNALDHWNPWPLLDRVGFNYQKYRDSEEYPTAAWDHILRHGMNQDRWGFVSHVNDPISLTYYQYMSGNDPDNQRQLEQQDNNNIEENNMEGQWFTELTASISNIQSKHKNVETYWIQDQGHCSFGLYYALQSDGFEEWAGDLLRENSLVEHHRLHPAMGALCTAISLALLSATVLFCISKESRSEALQVMGGLDYDHNMDRPSVWRKIVRQSSVALETADSFLSETGNESLQTSSSCCNRVKAVMVSWMSGMAQSPVTVALTVTITVYFWIMIVTEGLAHPLNNPSLGPTAIGLSRYGINNPSLIVYYHQCFRILTANILCSGILSYALVLGYLAYPVRSLEMTLSKSLHMLWIILLLGLGINLLYSSTLEGASCSCLALVTGLQSCHWVLKQRRGLPSPKILPIVFLVLVFVVSLLFPFENQWMILASALVVGPLVGWFGLQERSPFPQSSEYAGDDKKSDYHKATVGRAYVGGLFKEAGQNETSETNDSNAWRARWYTYRAGILYVYVVWFLVIAVGVRFPSPNKLYLEPFYTGCTLFYSTDVANVAWPQNDSNNDDEHRRLEEAEENKQNNLDGSSMCAEFCIPHMASHFVHLGKRKMGITVTPGQCINIGYDQHVADKTFTYLTYSLDVEVYTSSSSYN